MKIIADQVVSRVSTLAAARGPKGGLRTLSAESAREVSGTALLQKHYSDQKEAHKNVQADDKSEKDIHIGSYFPGQSGWPGREKFGAEEGT
jgi:hypothetical protein